MAAPPRIAVVSEPLVSSRYGEAGLSLLRALEALPGTRLVASGRADPAGIRRDLQRSLKAAPDGAAVLLVGGAATMPFFEIPLRPALDADALVPTDNPYAVPGSSAAPADVALPSLPIGRIPDHPDDTASSFARRIEALCGSASDPAHPGTYYLLAAKTWERPSRAMGRRLDPGAAVDLAPPRAPRDFEPPSQLGAGARRYLFNLHGSDRDARWFGQDGPSFPPAVDPGSVAALGAQGRIAGAVVVSQACYGAFLLMPGGLRRPGQACGLEFLEQGAAGFVGATSIAYGAADDAMVCSDVLAVEFLLAASAGAELGQALGRARAVLASAVRSPPAGAELKTLLQFVLYGDPLRRWAPVAAAHAPPPAGPPSAPGAPGSVLADYGRWSEEVVPTARAVAPEEEAPAWTETARHVAAPERAARGEAKGVPARRQLHRRVDRGFPAAVARFRESVIYPDGGTFEAESTGGRALASIEEERAGAAPWWSHAAAARARPSGASGPRRRKPAEVRRRRARKVRAPKGGGRGKPGRPRARR